MSWDATGYGSHAETGVASPATPTQVFAAGHGSAGVTAPATSWFLAEGATGPFFDLFILVANPNVQAATVTLDYLLSDGRTITKSYVVPANGRFTVWVDDEQIPASSGVKPLDNVAVSTTVTSTNSVPIIVERAMWWPGPALTSNVWTEAHNSGADRRRAGDVHERGRRDLGRRHQRTRHAAPVAGIGLSAGHRGDLRDDSV